VSGLPQGGREAGTTGQKSGNQLEGGIMTAAGHILVNIAGTIGWTSPDLDSRCVVARPPRVSRIVLSLNRASNSSSAFVTGIRGATPPPAG